MAWLHLLPNPFITIYSVGDDKNFSDIIVGSLNPVFVLASLPVGVQPKHSCTPHWIRIDFQYDINVLDAQSWQPWHTHQGLSMANIHEHSGSRGQWRPNGNAERIGINNMVSYLSTQMISSVYNNFKGICLVPSGLVHSKSDGLFYKMCSESHSVIFIKRLSLELQGASRTQIQC